MGSSLSKHISERRARRLTRVIPLSPPAIQRESGFNLNSPTARIRRQTGFNLPSFTALTRRKSALTRLPNELLLEIAKHLGTARNLMALILVNKQLAMLLDHLLADILLRAFRGPRATPRPLFANVMRHPDALVVRLLRLGVDLNAMFCHCVGSPTYCRCMPALHTAIEYSNVAMVDSLLRHGASIDARFGYRGDNAVHLAIQMAEIRSGHFKILREENMTMLEMLLGGGRLQTMNDPASMNDRGTTWLSAAVRICASSHVTLVEPFLSPGLSIDVADREYNFTPLHIAVLNNRVDLVELLLKHGADYQTTDSRGKSPYVSACNRPNWGIMDLFLRHDVTLINVVVNEQGETADLSFERHVGQLSLDPSESYGYLDLVWKKQQFLAKIMKLADTRRNSCIPDGDLQIYYNSL